MTRNAYKSGGGSKSFWNVIWETYWCSLFSSVWTVVNITETSQVDKFCLSVRGLSWREQAEVAFWHCKQSLVEEMHLLHTSEQSSASTLVYGLKRGISSFSTNGHSVFPKGTKKKSVLDNIKKNFTELHWDVTILFPLSQWERQGPNY